jgi:hypothetical protein
MSHKRGARPKTSKLRIWIPLDQDERDQVDAWGFRRQIRHRSDALRALVFTGLAAGNAAARGERRRATI